jgi:hypothetical protein
MHASSGGAVVEAGRLETTDTGASMDASSRDTCVGMSA